MAAMIKVLRMMAFLIPVVSASCPAPPPPPPTCEAASGATLTSMHQSKAGTTQAECCTSGTDCDTLICGSGKDTASWVNYGTTSTCCETAEPAITGKCADNDDWSEDVDSSDCPTGQALKGAAQNDYPTGTDASTCCAAACSAHSCPSGKTLIPYASVVTGSSDSECCYTTQYCTGNSGTYGDSHNRVSACVLFPDHTCSDGKILKSDASSIAGSTDAACCEDSCALFSCNSGYHLKDDASSIRGSTNSACCEADITGKCSGNTNAADFTCGNNKVLKSNSASITGNTVDACCDTSCSSVTCESGQQNQGSVAGTTTSACCQSGCTTFTCGTNQRYSGSSFGSTAADCCEDVVSGKCAGNTNSPYEVSCDSNKALDYTCSDFDCASMCTGCTGNNPKAKDYNIASYTYVSSSLCYMCCQQPGSSGNVDGATQAAVSAVIITAVLSFSAMS